MGRRRGRRRLTAGLDGVLLVDKPSGPTSRAVVDDVQRRLGVGKAGHAGTLDPAASGLLVVLLEEGTKLSVWATGCDKRYVATIQFGVATDTLDREGAVTEEVVVPAGWLTWERVEAALPALVGDVQQVPPIYAAIKRDGRSLMSRARAGEPVEVEARAVTCHALDLLDLDAGAGRCRLRVHCGKGYYVRSLARDLGAELGLPAHLAALRRTQVGAWRVEEAVEVTAVSAERVVPLGRALPGVAIEVLDAAGAEAVGYGRQVPATVDGARAILVDMAGAALAMAERTHEGRWRVARGFYRPRAGGHDSLIDIAGRRD